MRYRATTLWIALFLCLVAKAGPAAPAAPAGKAPAPPAQPAAGPGGSRYAHARVRQCGRFGQGARAYFLYEPADPTPVSAPVIVFTHGYLAVNPGLYGAWIEHLVRRGNVVIYPVYQAGFLGTSDYTADALAAVKDAFRRLAQEPGHVRPDGEGRWALVGHSMGCLIAANLSGMAEGLPRPRALMLVEPGEMHTLWPWIPSILRPASGIPDLLLLVIVGNADSVVGERPGRQIFAEATGVRPANRNLICVRSDSRGKPPLVADHFAPMSVSRAFDAPGFMGSVDPLDRGGLGEHMGVDALDTRGYWKWLDALTDAAFYGRDREYALGNTPAQRSLGNWSDGSPVREPEVEIGK